MWKKYSELPSYCNELIENLHLRFPRPEILTVIPDDNGKKNIRINDVANLWDKLSSCLEQTRQQTTAEYQCFKI